MDPFSDNDILSLHALSLALFAPQAELCGDSTRHVEGVWRAAQAHHVLIRAGHRIRNLPGDRPGFLDDRIADEERRIAAILRYLPLICRELESKGASVVVIKSLDHWPDFGSDIDLFTDTPEEYVTAIMRSCFDAAIVPPTLSDRLAGKVNYRLPGLRELVEVHFGRLGQTGEHVEAARRITERRRVQVVGESALPVPADEERVILAALQRMYRHFCFRICDIANAAAIVESGGLDFDELRHASRQAGIWAGVAGFLNLVSQYIEHYRGRGLRLPYRVRDAARLGLEEIYPYSGYLRLPLFPQAALLYGRQFVFSMRRDLAACFRLALLPPLAAAAGVKYRLTGSDKGVW